MANVSCEEEKVTRKAILQINEMTSGLIGKEYRK